MTFYIGSSAPTETVNEDRFAAVFGISPNTAMRYAQSKVHPGKRTGR